MTTTQYNSNNSLTPEIKWTSFEKRNNLDELINILIKAEERSMIRISCRTQDANIRQAQSGIRVQKYSWSTIRCVFKIRQSARFTAKIHNPCDFWGQIRRSETYSAPSSINIIRQRLKDIELQRWLSEINNDTRKDANQFKITKWEPTGYSKRQTIPNAKTTYIRSPIHDTE